MRKEALHRDRIIFQFETLKNQVNPHFLFNNFSTLIGLIEEKKELAIEYVEHLSDFFRNILEVKDKNLITVNEELKFLESYLYIQRMRYGKNLKVEINIPDHLLESMLPTLSLQMLIENAIKHNVISNTRLLVIYVLAENGNKIIVENKINKS